MEVVKVVKVTNDVIEFDDGSILESYHESDCCEHHWLGLSDINIDDFKGLAFNINSDSFFSRIEGYGISLNPINGFPIRIPGYGCNNGYYSSQLELVIRNPKEKSSKKYDITDCQTISD